MPKITKRRFLALGMFSGMLTSPLLRKSAWAANRPPGKGRLLQGPMTGAVSPDSIKIWLRVSDSFDVAIAYGRTPDLVDAKTSVTARPSRDQDYAAVLSLEGLRPNAAYYYRVLVDGEPDPYAKARPFRFKTAPKANEDITFSVAIGSCARYAADPVQPIWNSVDRYDPDLFFWMGDNIYGDSGSTATLADEYKRQRSVGTYQAVASRIPQLAIWDDHDYAFNNSDRTNPIKAEALQIFRKYWANPAYGADGVPGVFFDYTYGGVDFFFLDVRYHRHPNDDPDRPGKSMLGMEQLEWLKERLASSNAPFKVLLSGSGWTKAKGPGGDSWASFIAERDELFEFIRQNSVGGVVLCSGDTHVAELNAIPWSEKGGYDFYDLVSSPLAQTPSPSWLDRKPEMRIRQAFAGSPNFGLLTFRMQPEPVLSYNVINQLGEAVWPRFEILASELRNGKDTALRKMDDLSRTRFLRAKKGEPYYQ
ncbi:MAG TPA: alkaline phosphatase D family protein [Woeseiaceae bacterium]|nr:alkaline phosphatase D family protein [Woeseiaceae bacterium]